MPINGYNPTLNALLAMAAMKAKSVDSTEELEKPANRPENEATNNTQATKPAPQKAPATTTDIISNAVLRTAEAGSKAGAIFTEGLLKEGIDAAGREEANLTPKQSQVYNLIQAASTQAVRLGITASTAAAIAKNIVDDYMKNDNFDPDAVLVAGMVVQDFMGGMQT